MTKSVNIMRKLPAALPSFVRRPNFEVSPVSPSHTRSEIFHSARELVDPTTDRRVLLIGTLNASMMQVARTLSALKAFNPDAFVVQTTDRWFDFMHAVHGRNPQLTQRDIFATPFRYMATLPPPNLRYALFLSRFYLWRTLVFGYLGLRDSSGDAFTPGLEVYRSTELMRRAGVPTAFLGFEFNAETLVALEGETHMNLLDLAVRMLRKGNWWTTEVKDLQERIALHGFSAFAEHADDPTAVWLARLLEKLAPLQKSILIDKQDESIFRRVFEAKERRVACLVNYWHVPGVEYLWRSATGTHTGSFVNPVGDFDINEHVNAAVANDKLQRLASRLSRTEPATHSAYLTQYVKQATEWERERHGFFRGYKDPELEHLLYAGENDHVEHLPYKKPSH